jgi:hypothetical protein
VKRIGAVVVRTAVGIVVFVTGTGVVAALLTAIGQTGWSPRSSVSIALGLRLDVLKWGAAFWAGYRAHKVFGAVGQGKNERQRFAEEVKGRRS